MINYSIRVLYFKSLVISSALWFISYPSLIAQYDDLKNNPDILWIAEFSTDHHFSLTESTYFHENIKLIKFKSDPSNLLDANKTNWLSEWLYNDFMKKEAEYFKDPLLKYKLSKKAFIDLVVDIDTVSLFDTSDFEEGVTVVSSDLDPRDIEQWEAYQIIYYDQRSTNFKTKLISLAPLIRSESGKLIPLFWIKMNELFPSKFDLNSSDIPWCILSSTRESHLDLNFIKVTKGENQFRIKQELQYQALNLSKTIKSAEGIYGMNEPLSKTEVINIYNRKDTIVKFDPDNYDEQIIINDYSLNPDDISQFRLVQLWYFDSKKRKLINQLKALAPMQRIYGEDKEYRFSKPLYYIQYE